MDLPHLDAASMWDGVRYKDAAGLPTQCSFPTKMSRRRVTIIDASNFGAFFKVKGGIVNDASTAGINQYSPGQTPCEATIVPAISPLWRQDSGLTLRSGDSQGGWQPWGFPEKAEALQALISSQA